MLDKRKFCYYFFIVLAVFSGIVSSQQLQVTPEVLTVADGEENVNLLCRSSKPVEYCTFTVQGLPPVGLTDKKPSSIPELSYFGEGLSTGQCGVTIHKVSFKNSGNSTCTVFIEDGKSLTGTAEIIVATPPKQLLINVQSKNTNQGQQVTAQCIAVGGNPPVSITWFLDDEQLYNGVGDQVIEYPNGQNELTDLEVTSEFRKTLTADDNNKILECRARSVAIRDPEGFMVAKSQLTVEFPPVSQPEIQIFDLHLNQPAYLTVNVKANPKPNFEWIVDGTGIQEGKVNGRFEFMPAQKLDDGSYNVTLRIAELTSNDLMIKYVLSATNSAGQQEYYVKISSETQPAGLGVGEIIGIILACLVILAAIGLVVAARAMGKWCFAGSSSTSTTKMSETSDTESAEVKQTISKAQRLKNIFTMKMEKKSTKTAESELQQSGNENISGETVVGEEATAGGGNKQAAKSEKDLVYAELALKIPEDMSAPKKESTEYAEIIYPPTTKTAS